MVHPSLGSHPVNRFDLAIIGSGGAAFSAAIRAHDLGAERLVLIEHGEVGGTCVNVGCVPSKALLAAAHQHHHASGHPFAGVPHSDGAVELGALMAQKARLVDEMRQGKYLDLAGHYGFELIGGHAAFAAPDRIDVDGRAVYAEAVLLATGAEPVVPELPGIGAIDVLTSTSAMELTELPDHLIVIGAGFVGLEQAQLFSRLGSKVTLIGRLAPRAEPELSAVLAESLGAEGIELRGCRAVGARLADSGVEVELDDGTSVVGSHLLAAAGRHPRTSGLALERAGIELTDEGAIRVDAHQKTTAAHIYAAGDVTGGRQFVYLAAAQGTVAAENAVADLGTTVDLRGLPSVVFTDPQLASVGLTEAAAIDAGHDVDARTRSFDNVPRAVVEHETRGAIKLIADTTSRRILGVHALAPAAGELMLAATMAIRSGMTVNELASTWAPYLTTAESLRLVARSFEHDVDRLSCCA